MSYTETHFGKFKVLARGRENINNYIKENNIEVDDPNDKNLYPVDDKYCITYPYYEDDVECLIEFIEHTDLDDGNGFSKYSENPDGTIDFVVQFYNGDCWLGEALSDFEHELKKQKK